MAPKIVSKKPLCAKDSVIYNLRRKRKSVLDEVFENLNARLRVIRSRTFRKKPNQNKPKNSAARADTEHAATRYAQPFKELSNLEN